MNASSNYRIIMAVIDAVRSGETQRIYSPGVFGLIGGYPVCVSNDKGVISAKIDESVFSLSEMEAANRKSLYLDGIEDVKDGNLIYTDELLYKVIKAFDVDVPKIVPYEKIDETAELLINKIIKPATAG